MAFLYTCPTIILFAQDISPPCFHQGYTDCSDRYRRRSTAVQRQHEFGDTTPRRQTFALPGRLPPANVFWQHAVSHFKVYIRIISLNSTVIFDLKKVHTVLSVDRSPCAVCDMNVVVKDQHFLSASDLPNKNLLVAGEMLQKHERVMSNFCDYPGDTTKQLHGLVLSKHGFSSAAPFQMHVCDDCYRSLKSSNMPDAALANGFWVGTLPEHFQDMTFVERAAAYPVRIKGRVIALESRRVNNAPGTAKRSLRGTSVFYANDASSVAKELPLAAIGLLDMITVVLAGKHKLKFPDLGRLLGARRAVISYIIEYMRSENLVVGFPLARSLPVNNDNINSYPSDGGIPQAFSDAILRPDDPADIRGKVASSYTLDRQEKATSDNGSSSDDSSDISSEDGTDQTDPENDGKAYIIDRYAVMNSGEDEATSLKQLPDAMRRLGDELDPEAALRRGLPPDTPNALVIPSGEILDDFSNNSAWVEAYATYGSVLGLVRGKPRK